MYANVGYLAPFEGRPHDAVSLSMRYRAFPIASTLRPKPRRRRKSIRTALTLFGAAFILGGLGRLATNDDAFAVATGDLGPEPVRAASSERESEGHKEQRRKPPRSTSPS